MINDFAMPPQAQNKSRVVGHSRLCVWENVLVIWFFPLNFSWRWRKYSKAQKESSTEWRQIAQKISICQKNISKDIIKLKNDLRSVSQLLDESQTPIIKASSEIHKTQHFIKV